MPVTLMWGERGLIATLLMDLSAITDCTRWIAFLRQIQFVPPGPDLDWSQVNNVWAVVEPGFGNRGFGSPDAVFLLSFADGRRVVILLEAKLSHYLEACWRPSDRGRKGFNSRLNGQLELNHCLALALSQYQPGDKQLIDPDWVLQTPYLDARPTGSPRRVDNPAVRKILAEPVANADLYLHAIITADQHNPLADQTTQPLWPEIFIQSQPVNMWSQEASQFGWTNWRSLWELAENWEPIRFRKNLAFNLPNLFPPETSAVEDILPISASEVLPADWPPVRPAKGVSLTYAPGIDPQTFLHFSWRFNGCCLRNYSQNPPFFTEDRSRNTMQVLDLITLEESCGARRPAYQKSDQWYSLIASINRRHGLGR